MSPALFRSEAFHQAVPSSQYVLLHGMKRTVAAILSIAVFLNFSCTKGTDIPSSLPERDLSTPEKVEKEIMEVLSKDWNGLSDTIAYFHSTLLSEGKMEGTAPDGVYYRLRISFDDMDIMTMDFQIGDSLWASAKGRFYPLEISLNALDTELTIAKEALDSTSLSFSNIKIISPDLFLFNDRHQAGLLYEERRVGFISREEFENTDYSTGNNLVFHYYDDPRTFAFYDKGLCDVLNMNLADVLK